MRWVKDRLLVLPTGSERSPARRRWRTKTHVEGMNLSAYASLVRQANEIALGHRRRARGLRRKYERRFRAGADHKPTEDGTHERREACELQRCTPPRPVVRRTCPRLSRFSGVSRSGAATQLTGGMDCKPPE